MSAKVTVLTIPSGTFPPTRHDLHFWQFKLRAVFQVIGRRIPLLVANAGVTSAFYEKIPDRVGILARGAIVQSCSPLLNRTRQVRLLNYHLISGLFGYDDRGFPFSREHPRGRSVEQRDVL